MANPTVFPSDAALREHAAQAMKLTTLFSHVSARLLADLVQNVGLIRLGHLPVDTVPKQPAVLLVLEGRVRLNANVTLVLGRGTYLASDPAFAGVDWTSPRIESGEDESVRAFLLSIQAWEGLPRVIINAMDPLALADLNASLKV